MGYELQQKRTWNDIKFNMGLYITHINTLIIIINYMNKIISLDIIINYRYSTHYKIIHYDSNFTVTRSR